MLGMVKEFLIGKPLAVFIIDHQHRAFYRHLLSLQEQSSSHSFELVVKPRQAPPRDVAMTVAPRPGLQKNVMELWWILRDRTHVKRTEQLATIGLTAAGLAHESRNILQRAHAGLERLRWRVQKQPELLDLVARVQQTQDELTRLFEELRGFVGPLRLNRENLLVPETWRVAWSQTQALFPTKQAELREQLGEFDLHCQADRFRLTQVFRNLMENAFAACGNAVRIEIAARETMFDGRQVLSIDVRDNGPGLNDEQQQRLFEPFFSTKPQGTGLGLVLSQRIVEAHGGRIVLAATSAGGTEFQILLPRS
jgi:signal transduction histidine kinase